MSNYEYRSAIKRMEQYLLDHANENILAKHMFDDLDLYKLGQDGDTRFYSSAGSTLRTLVEGRKASSSHKDKNRKDRLPMPGLKVVNQPPSRDGKRGWINTVARLEMAVPAIESEPEPKQPEEPSRKFILNLEDYKRESFEGMLERSVDRSDIDGFYLRSIFAELFGRTPHENMTGYDSDGNRTILLESSSGAADFNLCNEPTPRSDGFLRGTDSILRRLDDICESSKRLEKKVDRLFSLWDDPKSDPA